jgi:hypothetical protein
MAQEVRTESLLRTRPKSFPKIDAFFDSLEHTVERSESLIWKSKRLIFGTGFMLFLIYELAHFAKFLMHNWKGS